MKIRAANSSRRAGFALILVMITIIALTSLVASFAISMNTEVRLARNSDYDQEMEWMGRSGIEMARYALANKSPEQRGMDALNQYWAGGTSMGSNDISSIVNLKNQPLGNGAVSVNVVDMERKWSINMVANPAAPQRDVLQNALNLVGVTDTGVASTIVDSILDWANPNTSSGTGSGFSGAKDEYYGHLNPPYFCKDGQFDDLSELLLIRGVTPEMYFGINSSNHAVSPYQQHGGGAFGQPSGNGHLGMRGNNDEPVYQIGLTNLFSPMGGKLNINTASATALRLIPGMDENTAAHIIQQRAGPDGVEGNDDDAPFQNIGEINGGLPGGGGLGRPPANIPGAPPAGIAAQGLAAYIDVRSYVFDVQVTAEINGYKKVYHGIVSRAGPSGQQTRCVKFYWE